MDADKESQWWWFDNNKSSNCSPWLESTLADLNEKTKTMLKLIEGDADSFAQRAEMYYKKRPELISLVQDFYQTHCSLAERYDQLKTGRSVHVKSPLRDLLSSPKDSEYENRFNSSSSSKSFDGFIEVTYSSDEFAESEVDDPELEDDIPVDLVEGKKENPVSAWSGNHELTKLKEELDRLREENEIQRAQIKDSYQDKEELVNQLSDNISEIKKLREEFEAMKGDNSPFEEIKTISCDFKSLKLFGNENVKPREEEKVESDNEVVKKFEEVKQELMKIEEENKFFKEALALKETLLKWKEEEKEDAEIKLEKVTKELMKLREATQRKDRYLFEILDEKDEEKRAVIRQLSLAMEILREDNHFLKKAIEKDSPKRKNPSQFQMFKGAQFSKWFKPPSRRSASTVNASTVIPVFL